MTRRWLVTGCSSGLGQALAQAAAQAGDQVVATARRPETLAELVGAWPDRISPVTLDVRDARQCQDAVDAAVERLGGVDVLVNNAGGGLYARSRKSATTSCATSWRPCWSGRGG